MSEDQAAIQRAIAIRRQNPKVKIIVQLLLHKNKHRLYLENVDIYCVEEIKLGLMGRSVAVKGLTTLVRLPHSLVSVSPCFQVSTIFQFREYVDFNTKVLKKAKKKQVGDQHIDEAQLAEIHNLYKQPGPLTWTEEWLLSSARDISQMMVRAHL